MTFNPEDENDFGPHCRNCHKGSTACGTCHQENVVGITASTIAYTTSTADAADDSQKLSTYYVFNTTTGQSNMYENSWTAAGITYAFYKKSRDVDWPSDWRTTTTIVDSATINGFCSDDGFSWPHRTLGWMMLKDDLFGLAFDGSLISVGETRTVGATDYVVHDVDSVCLDCHNPTAWNADSPSHVDSSAVAGDDFNDELLLRGLP